VNRSACSLVTAASRMPPGIHFDGSLARRLFVGSVKVLICCLRILCCFTACSAMSFSAFPACSGGARRVNALSCCGWGQPRFPSLGLAWQMAGKGGQTPYCVDCWCERQYRPLRLAGRRPLPGAELPMAWFQDREDKYTKRHQRVPKVTKTHWNCDLAPELYQNFTKTLPVFALPQ